MSDTPRTDKAAYEYPLDTKTGQRDGVRWCSLLNEARRLERELVEAKDKQRQDIGTIMNFSHEINRLRKDESLLDFLAEWGVEIVAGHNTTITRESIAVVMEAFNNEH